MERSWVGLLIPETPAFIITLAGMFFVRGMSFIVSEESIPIDHPIYSTLANYAWKVPGGGRFTLLALIMLLVVAFGILLANRTRFGHNVYAIGGNSVSAALMGVPVRQTTIKIYMLSSTLAALSGIVFSFTPPQVMHWRPVVLSWMRLLLS